MYQEFGQMELNHGSLVLGSIQCQVMIEEPKNVAYYEDGQKQTREYLCCSA